MERTTLRSVESRHLLVTGGAGFIGSHAAKALAQAGYTPVVLDNFSTGHKENVRWGPLVVGDVGDRELVRRVLREYGVGGVVHFAASAYVGESTRNPGKYYRNNVSNMLVLLEEMRDADVRHIVFSSSCATYGEPKSLPITEEHLQRPVNPYGQSKLFGEKMLEGFGEAHGLRWLALRYFNAAGADPDAELREVHNPETHLIPLVIDAALGKKPFIEIFGSDYPTVDGTAVRDYIHVTDLANAHALAMNYLLNGGGNIPINLGTGRGYSVSEVISAVERIADLPVPVRYGERREGDPSELVADSRRASEVLDWKAQYSDLDDIVRTAWKSRASTSGAPIVVTGGVSGHE